MNLVIDVKQKDNEVFVKISGEIDAYTAPELKENLQPSTEMENPNITVDLSDVSYMDSTGLGVFVWLFKTAKSKDGQLTLTGLSERLQRLFDITGLGEIMTIKVEGGVE